MLVLPNELSYALAASVAALVGAICDVRSRRIPNEWTGGCIVIGLILHLCLDGWQGLGDAALAGILAGGGFLLLYVARGMGAGDVKLITASGCLTGLPGLALMLVTTVVAGAAMAVALAIHHRKLRQTLGRALGILAGRGNGGSAVYGEPDAGPGAEPGATARQSSLHMPFAVPIAFGCLCSLYCQLSR